MDYNFLHNLFFGQTILVNAVFLGILLLLILITYIFKKKVVIEQIWLIYGTLYIFGLIYITIISRMRMTPVLNPFLKFLNLGPFSFEYFQELAGNIILFMPLGAVFGVLVDVKRPKLSVLTTAFLTSLLIEFFQMILLCGYVEPLDMIMNCSGAFLGLIMAKASLKCKFIH